MPKQLTRLTFAISLSLLAASFFTFSTSAHAVKITPKCEVLAELTAYQGRVRVQPAGAALPLRQIKLPVQLCSGDLVTSLNNSQAHLSYAQGQLVLDANSQVEISTASQLNLNEGTGLFKITQQAGAASFAAHTPLVVIGVKGTSFLLSSSPEQNSLALVEGKVNLTRQDQKPLAHYVSKPAKDLTFAEYLQQQEAQLTQYKNRLEEDFNDYKALLDLEFTAFKSSLDINPGQEVRLNASSDEPQALEEPITAASQQLYKRLALLLNR